ncbi:glycosyltransferase family 4 protein [Kribbella sp. NBC_01245]|uniref:glycosyltransferase family 4 protein n=1 Tax=Kribbella sp. NBC_01245 TaxID=2903578 RepID=UPI002E2B2F3F|nr:glycosyltransferase family 4 protein [Kribbella sp. NBC_01245]
MSSDPLKAAAFYRELTARVRQTAERRGTSSEAEFQQFVLQRVMARQFTANPDAWMVKGGQTLLARWENGRSTSDIDMVGMPGASRDTMVGNYTSALELDLDDHLTFQLEYDGELQHGAGARLKHKAFIGGREIGEVSVDLAPPRDRPMWAEPELIKFPEQIMSTGASGENPRLRVISLTDTLAHKVAGMYTQGVKTEQTKCDDCLPRTQGQWACQTGDLPYRVQDLVDVMMIATNEEWDAGTVQAMLHEEFSWRISQGEPLRPPNKYYRPNPAWTEGFAKYAGATPGLPFKTLAEAEPVARAFLDPLLDRTKVATGKWDPDAWQWTGQTTSVQVSGPELPKQRVLVVAHASGRSAGLGGLPVASGDLTKALAGLENAEVTLLTVGETEEHGEAKIVSITPDGQSARVQLLDVATNGTPDQIPGMPIDRGSFDLVIGHARFSGYQAMLIRNRWYPTAQLAHVMHMPSREYGEVQGQVERGIESHRIESAVVQNADIVVGVGPLLTNVGAEMADGARVPPSFHELVPGVETLGEVGDPPSGENFNLLFSGRVGDPIKGYDDLLATTKELADRGVPIQLRVRGVKPDQLQAEQQRADQIVGRPGVVHLLPYTPDKQELLGDYRWAHAAVMPSKIEGYGLVGAEAAAHGVPVLVNAESGVGQFLADGNRIPERLGAASVVPDQGLRNDQAGRVEVWAGAIQDLRGDYANRREAAGELKGVLQNYTRENSAKALLAAAREAHPGANVSTQQGANGAVLPVTRRPTTITTVAPTQSAEAGHSVKTEPTPEQAPEAGDMARFLQSGSPSAAPTQTTATGPGAGESDRTHRNAPNPPDRTLDR